jgi:hypothetical protein
MSNIIQFKPEKIVSSIYFIRGEKVMLDSDLASLYAVETRTLKQAVKRNIKRFPEDFMFELTREEYNSLTSQIVILKKGRGEHSKYLPFAFTEQGVAMLSSILNSDRAIQVNIAIMRAFVQLRKLMETHKDLAKKIVDMEKKYDKQFQVVFEAIKQLISKKNEPRNPIGFRIGEKKK